MQITEFLKQFRKERKMSLRQFSKMAGVPVSTLFYIEKGEVKPSYVTLAKLCTFCDINISELLTQKGVRI